MPNFPDPLPGETPKQYRGFCAYCALGAYRSLAKVAQESGKHITLYGRWSTANKWGERAAQYDRDVSAERAQALDAGRWQAIEAERVRLLADATRRRILMASLEQRLYQSVVDSKDDKLTPSQIATWAIAVAKLAQAARDDMAMALGIAGLLARSDAPG